MSGFWAGAVPPWAYAVGACLWILALLLGMWVGFGRGERAADAEEERLLREQAKARRTHPVYRQPPELAHDDSLAAIKAAGARAWDTYHNTGRAIDTGEIQAITDEMDTWLAVNVYSAPADYGQWLEQQDR